MIFLENVKEFNVLLRSLVTIESSQVITSPAKIILLFNFCPKMNRVPTKLQVQSNQPTKTARDNNCGNTRQRCICRCPGISIRNSFHTWRRTKLYFLSIPLRKKDMFHQRNEGYKTRNTKQIQKMHISQLSQQEVIPYASKPNFD